MSEKTTTIGIKETTRKRLAFVRDLMSIPDYDTCINSLLDGAGYPKWAEAEKFSKKSVKASTGVPA